MAKNQNPEPKPKVSKLPLPATDSPLVIDLPDGQKIVIGKMTNGSVIEVATWRGVGRPDSRTSRLMLGVGNGEVEEASSESASGQSENSLPKPSGIAQIPYFASKFFTVVQKKLTREIPKIFGTIYSKLKNRPEKNNSLSRSDLPKVEIAKKDSAIDPEVQEWLDRITQSATERSKKSSSIASKNSAKGQKGKSKSQKTKRKTN